MLLLYCRDFCVYDVRFLCVGVVDSSKGWLVQRGFCQCHHRGKTHQRVFQGKEFMECKTAK